MDPSLVRDLLVALIAGATSGLVTWGGIKTDVRWLKETYSRIEREFQECKHEHDTRMNQILIDRRHK